VEAEVRLAPDARVGLGSTIAGTSEIEGSIGPNCTIADTRVGRGSRVLAGSICEGAVIGEGCVVGPMARLRPGAVIEDGAHIGNFVEVKNAIVRRGAKANHLTYLGDAEVGEGANVGAGTITCNYDGFAKHRTTIGPGAFIGSNTALVAPVAVGAGAVIGAGSTITADVPPDAVTLTRAPTRQHEGGAVRLRARLKAAAEARKRGES
jgi:bifunctional UDP-N-acetylglucosamine pyrophosphorylase/glucosamine-1-phosphate N-acetyltransferase